MRGDKAPWLLSSMVFAGATIVVFLLIAGYVAISDRLLRLQAMGQQQTTLGLQAESFVSAIQAPAEVALILASLPVLHRIADRETAADLQQTQALFLETVSARPSLLQLRFIDATGQERIRIDRVGAEVRASPEADLQDKSNRYYFTESINLPIGSTYVSPIDLNIEHGEIEQPWRPVLRVASPIVQPSGRTAGVVVVNVDASDLIASFVATGDSAASRILIDQAGHMLAGAEESELWGFMFGRTPNFPERYPAAWSRLEQQGGAQFWQGSRLYTLQTVSPIISSSGSPRRWHLVYVDTIPSTAAALTEPHSLIMLTGLLAILMLASWRCSRLWQDQNDAFARKAAAENTARRLESVMSTAVDGLIVIDSNGLVLDFNPACESMFGYAAQEVIGRNISMLMPAPYKAEHDGYLANYHRTGERKIIGIGREVAGRRKNGEEFPLELAVGMFKDGDVSAFVGVLRDITVRKALEADMEAQRRELLRSNQDLEQFAYIASHDLKSPLRGISNVANWLKEDLGNILDDEQVRLLEMVDQRIRRMEDLLEGILAYSHAGKNGNPCETVDPAAVIEELREFGLVPDGFVLTADPDLPKLTTEHAPFRQVLQNLIANAVKHHDRDHGTIRVRARENGAFVHFTVEDDGPGIPERHRERVFRMFERLNPIESGDGTGVGLALVKKLIERKGGRISVEESDGDRGAAFHFAWPKVDRPQSEA